MDSDPKSIDSYGLVQALNFSRVLEDTSPNRMCELTGVTVPKDGLYLVKGNSGLFEAPAGHAGVRFYIYVGGNPVSAVNCKTGSCSISHTVALHTGDLVRFRIYFWNGSTSAPDLALGSTSPYWATQFQVTYLGGS